MHKELLLQSRLESERCVGLPYLHLSVEDVCVVCTPVRVRVCAFRSYFSHMECLQLPFLRVEGAKEMTSVT